MKRLYLLALIALISCRKFVPVQESLSITVVNAIPMSSSIIPVFGTGSIEYFDTAQTVPYGSFFSYAPSGGEVHLYIAKSPDSTARLYTGMLSLKTNAIYTLFVG